MDELVIGAGIIMSIIILPAICVLIMSIGLDDKVESYTLSKRRIIISILLSIFIYTSSVSYLSHLSYKVTHSHDNEIKQAKIYNGVITKVDANDASNEYYKINLKGKGLTYILDEERSKITREDLNQLIKKHDRVNVKYKLYNDNVLIITEVKKDYDNKR